MYSCGWLTVFWRNVMPVGPSETFPTTYWTARCQNYKTIYRISSSPWEPQLRCKDLSQLWSIQLLSCSCPTSIQPPTTSTGCWLGTTLGLSACCLRRSQVFVSTWRTTWDRRIVTCTTFLTIISWKSATGMSTSHGQISQQWQNVASVWSTVFNFRTPRFSSLPCYMDQNIREVTPDTVTRRMTGVEQVMQAFHSYVSWSNITLGLLWTLVVLHRQGFFLFFHPWLSWSPFPCPLAQLATWHLLYIPDFYIYNSSVLLALLHFYGPQTDCS